MTTVDPAKAEGQAAFGRALTDVLLLRGVTQTAIAREIGVSTSTFSTWKLGQSEPDQPSLMFALERALDVPAGSLSRHLGYVPVTPGPPEPDPPQDPFEAAELALVRALRAVRFLRQ